MVQGPPAPSDDMADSTEPPTKIEPSNGVNEPNGSSASHASWHSTWRTTVLLVIVAVAVNLPYQYVILSSRHSGSLQTVVDFKAGTPMAYPQMGGFPYRYWISYDAEAEPSGVKHRRFSAIALLYDVLIASLLMGGILFYVHRRRVKFAHRIGKSSKSLSIADLMVLTLVLACPFAAWQLVSSRYSAVVALQQKVTNAGGGVRLMAWGPWWCESIIPDAISEKLVRLHGVRLDSAAPSLTNEVSQSPVLQTLRLGGSSVTPELIAGLLRLPHLTDLRIAGSKLSTEQFRVVSTIERLQTLNLMRTNLDADAFQEIQDGRNLTRVNLIHTDLPLASLSGVNFSETMQELWVGHPAPGGSDTLEISNWPNLQILKINEFDSQANSVPLPVRLADLPQLKSVQVDAFQAVSLEIENTPELTILEDLSFEWQSRIGRGGRVPGAIWASVFKLTSVPQLKQASIFVGDLRELKIIDVPELTNFGIGAFYRTYSAETYQPKLATDAAAAMINGLGQSDGPVLIDLEAVPLAGVDISRLAENQGIFELLLSNSQTEASQWMSLAPMKQLTRLEVKGNPIDNDQLGALLGTFPNLHTFACSPGATSSAGFNRQRFVISSGETDLTLRDHSKLTTLDLDLSNIWGLNEVTIVNMPKLRFSLDINSAAKLTIRDAPRLSGLSVQGYFPTSTELGDIQQIEHVAVGGPSVTDSILDSIANSRNLSSLTLAYPQISEAAFAAIGNFEFVNDLHLPGSAVNDSVIENWPRFPMLTSLDLSDTAVTTKGLQRLLPAAVYLSELAIAGMPILASELSLLANQDQLLRLDVGGVGLDPTTIGVLLGHGRLKYLDLSGTVVDATILKAIIQSARSLEYLGLRNCEVDSNSLAMLAGKYPQMVFDVSGSDVSSELEASLVSTQRLSNVDQWRNHSMMRRAQGNVNAMSAYQDLDAFADPFPARIDVAAFAPQTRGDAADTGFGAATSERQPGAQTVLRGTTAWNVTPTPGTVIAQPLSPAFALGYWFGQLLNSNTDADSEVNDLSTELEIDHSDFGVDADNSLETIDELQ